MKDSPIIDLTAQHRALVTQGAESAVTRKPPRPDPLCTRCRGLIPRQLIAAMPEAFPVSIGGSGDFRPTAALPSFQFCSGTCMRLFCNAALVDALRAALDPGDFADLMQHTDPAALPPPSLPELRTHGQIREVVNQTVDAILSNRVTTKQASLVLYALQTATASLKAQRAEALEGAPTPETSAVGAPPIAAAATGISADAGAEVSRAERARMKARTPKRRRK